jgi:sodium-dependent dicarboxylate transporter 2/3/5
MMPPPAAAEALSPEALRLGWILAAVAVLWVTEALPLAVTALAGVAACVVLGVAPAREVLAPFADPLIFLFIGSFMLAEAIRVHGLDRRLAFAVLARPWVGQHPRRIVAAVAVVCAMSSGFLSNTATTAMMATIVAGILAAVEQAAAAEYGDRSLDPRYGAGLLLVVAFASSVGGLATPIGTPPNLIGLGFIRRELGIDVSFVRWLGIGVPLVAVMTILVIGIAWALFPARIDRLPGIAAHVAAERRKLGDWTAGQCSAALAFALTAFLWIAPGIIGFLLGSDHPLSAFLSARLPEGIVALLGAVLLFVLPGGPGRRALTWEEAARIDWGIVLLYGGGMALGTLSFKTGLADGIGRSITGFVPEGGGLALIAACAVVAAITSEFTSNTASANMVVPVAISLAAGSGGDPLPAALAATFAASLGFMMPVSTPCNAIVYGSGRIRLADMMRAGVLLDVAGAAAVSLALWALGGSR